MLIFPCRRGVWVNISGVKFHISSLTSSTPLYFGFHVSSVGVLVSSFKCQVSGVMFWGAGSSSHIFCIFALLEIMH